MVPITVSADGMNMTSGGRAGRETTATTAIEKEHGLRDVNPTVRLALAQLDFTVGAFESNFARMRQAIAQADQSGAELVVFSELAATGYPPRDLLNHARFVDLNLELVDRVSALSTGRLAILLGFVDRNPAAEGKRLFNAAALCWSGRIAGRQYKSLLPTYDVFDEDRYFEPAKTVAPLELNGRRLGVTICEDVWNDRDFWPERLYHRDPVTELADARADLLINISASPFELRKAALRRDMIRQAGRDHGRHFFYVNQVGGNDELVFDGHSIGIDPSGAEVVRARDFEEDFIVYDVPAAGALAPAPVLRDVSQSDEEAAYDAGLGLRDYARSAGSRPSCSACRAASTRRSRRAGSRCGEPAVIFGVACPAGIRRRRAPPTRASPVNLGIDFRVVPIDDVFQSSLTALAPVLRTAARPAEENLQARVAAPSSWRSRTSSTTCCCRRGTSPSSRWASAPSTATCRAGWRSQRRAKTSSPAGAVHQSRAKYIPEATIVRPPTAELRADQLDADSPPADVLDAIIDAYVGRRLDNERSARWVSSSAVVVDVIRKIDLSEYKRRGMRPASDFDESLRHRLPLSHRGRLRRFRKWRSRCGTDQALKHAPGV
jgi:predicted amidohydrolase